MTNEKLMQIAMALSGIANGNGSARLKYAANMNRTLIEGPLTNLEKVRTENVKGEKELLAFREKTILENCLRDEKDAPVVTAGGSYQFEDNNAFQAKLLDLLRKEFPEVLLLQEAREEEYRTLLKEEVDVVGFPYPVKWSFIDMDEKGRLVGLTGEQEYVLMSANMFDGEPPWLNDDAQPAPKPKAVKDTEEDKGKKE